jgi:hypothetical protein
MPFEKGNKYGKGRPPRGESLKELLTQVGVTRKQDLVKKAYDYAFIPMGGLDRASFG